MDMYKKAVFNKIRFSVGRGEATVEDLVTLSLTDLDTVAKAINKALKDSEEESFISPASIGNTTLRLKLEIVKDIISTKQEANEKKLNAKLKAQKREELEELIAIKKREGKQAMSVEDLEKELALMD